MEKREYIIVILAIFCSFFLAGSFLLFGTSTGLLGNVISGNSIKFIEGFYFSEPLPLTEEVFTFEETPETNAPYIERAFLAIEPTGPQLIVTGKNLDGTDGSGVYYVILDGEELDLANIIVDSNQGEIRITVKEHFEKEEHYVVIGTLEGESNTYYIEAEQHDINTVKKQQKDTPQTTNEKETYLTNTHLSAIPTETIGLLEEYGYLETPTNEQINEAEPASITECLIESITWKHELGRPQNGIGFEVQGNGCDQQHVTVGILEKDVFTDDILPVTIGVVFEGDTATGEAILEGNMIDEQLALFEGGEAELMLYVESVDLTALAPTTGRVTAAGGRVTSGILSLSGGSGTTANAGGPSSHDKRIHPLRGCSDVYAIDEDCDGRYAAGINAPITNYFNEMDPNDKDQLVFDNNSLYHKYGSFSNMASIRAYLSDRGYNATQITNIFFVDPINGNDTTGRPNNISLPYKTFHEIICDDQGRALTCEQSITRGTGKTREIREGDIVFFRTGYYPTGAIRLYNDKSYTLKGQPGKPTILMAYPGEKVVINELDIPGLGVSTNVSRHLVLDGMSILVSSSKGILVDEGNHQDLTFRNLGLYPINPNQSAHGIEFKVKGTRNNIRFENIMVRELQAAAIYMVLNDTSSDVTIQDSLIYHNRHGLQLQGIDRLNIQRNIFHNHLDHTIRMQDGIQDATIENNLFFSNQKEDLFFLSAPPRSMTVRDNENNVITNNIFWKSAPVTTHSPISIFHLETVVPITRQQFRNFTNNTITNNIFYLAQNNSAIIFQALFNHSWLEGSVNQTTITDNLLYESNPQSTVYRYYGLSVCGWSDGSHDTTNLANGTCGAGTYSWHTTKAPLMNRNTVASAAFENVSIPTSLTKPQLLNFYPKNTSGGRDKGTFTLAPGTDIQGRGRIGAAPDIGAYEIQGNPTCTYAQDTQPCTNQQGVCAGSSETCGSGGHWNGCTFYDYYKINSSYEPLEVSCDGLDNDCDGRVDEDGVCPSGPPFRFNISTTPGSASVTYGPSPNGTTTNLLIQKIGTAPDEPISLSASNTPGISTGFNETTCNFNGSRSCSIAFTIDVNSLLDSQPDTFSISIVGTSTSYSTSDTFQLTTNKNSPQLQDVQPRTFTNGTAINLTFAGANFDSAVNVSANGVPIGIGYTRGGNLFNFIASANIPGRYDLRVTNLNGKTSTNISVLVIDPRTPVLNSIHPNWAREGTTRVVQLQGAGFAPTNIVRINGATVSGTYIDANNINITIPASLANGTHSVSVETALGGSGKNSTFYILTARDPSLDNVNPARINNAYPQAISLLGANFTEFSGIQFGGGTTWIQYPLNNTIPMNDTLIRIFVEKGYPPGISAVRILNSDGRVSNPIPFEIYNQNATGPQTDFDLDGVTDQTDRCPKTPQRFHYLVDNNTGCPDIQSTLYKNNISTNLRKLGKFRNVTSFTLGLRGKGKVTFLENVTPLRQIPQYLLYYPLDIDTHVNISKNKVRIDSTNLPELNKQTEITFYNTSIKNTVPYRDGKECGDECSPKSYISTTTDYVLVVTEWSEYEVREGSCGDKYCSITETKTSCSQDCGGGGNNPGGGSGGGRDPKKNTAKTIPVNLDDEKKHEVNATTNTKYDLTINNNIYRAEITKIQNDTITINFTNTSKLLAIQLSQLYTVNIDEKGTEDIELFARKSVNTYTLTFIKIKEQTQKNDQTRTNTQDNKDKKPSTTGTEQPTKFKPTKTGYWTIITGILLTILLTYGIEHQQKQKKKKQRKKLVEQYTKTKKTSTKQNLQAKKAEQPIMPKPPTKTTQTPQQTRAAQTLQTNTTTQQPTTQNNYQQTPQQKILYRRRFTRPTNAHMTELALPFKEPKTPITNTKQTKTPTQPLQQRPLPFTEEQKKAMLDQSTEKTEEFDPYT